jgi:hypothetical protein
VLYPGVTIFAVAVAFIDHSFAEKRHPAPSPLPSKYAIYKPEGE